MHVKLALQFQLFYACKVGWMVVLLWPFDTFYVILSVVSYPKHTVQGRLSVLSAHSFASNWQLPFLNQWKGEFMTKSQRKNVTGPGARTSDPLIRNQTRYRLC